MTNTKSLAGMRVVEMSAFIAAPSGGMTLAQLGADVIRIDPPQGGLDYHRWPVTSDAVSLFWRGMNKSKRSVSIDTSRAAGRELATAIICAPGDDAGIFLSNFPAQGWRAHDVLRARRPDLIQLTLQGDRHGGSAIDPTVNCTVGLPLLTGPADDPRPVNHILPAWDLITGQMIAVGLLVAERRRSRTGEGQAITIALEDVALATMGHLGFIAESQLGTERTRQGNDIFGGFGRDFICIDGPRIMVVGLTLKQWRALCSATEIDAAVDALASQTGLDLDEEGNRYRVRQALAGLVQAWLDQKTFSEAKAAFERTGVCWGLYQSIEQMIRSSLQGPDANPLFATVDQPDVGPYLTPGQPMEFADESPAEIGPAPRLGQHTEEVLTELVGLSASELGKLHDQGLIKMV